MDNHRKYKHIYSGIHVVAMSEICCFSLKTFETVGFGKGPLRESEREREREGRREGGREGREGRERERERERERQKQRERERDRERES